MTTLGELIQLVLIGFTRQPIAPNKLQNLAKYKYSGVDKSLLSKHVFGPYWSWLVTKFPLWMAPNTITLLGLLAMVSAGLLVLYHSPDMIAPLPAWLYVYVAVCLFIYQSFDAIDGKQARRTGMAGPLGELFDHGCDALNLVLMGFVSPALFALPPDQLAFSLMGLALLAFYIATWEEYHTGTLYLGCISGPVEGTVMLILLCLVAAVGGGGVLWSRTVALPGGLVLPYNAILIYSSLLVAGGTIVTSLLNARRAGASGAAFARLLPFGGYTALCMGLYAGMAELRAFPNYILYFITVGLGFACAVARVITAHISKEQYPLWTPTFVPPLVVALWRLSRPWQRVDLHWVLSGCLVYCGLVYYLLITRTIGQICAHQGISCFSVRKTRHAA